MTPSLDFLSRDPLAVLRRRGMSAASSYEVCERVAYLQFMGEMSEIEAVELALGYVPHEIRDRAANGGAAAVSINQPKETA